MTYEGLEVDWKPWQIWTIDPAVALAVAVLNLNANVVRLDQA